MNFYNPPLSKGSFSFDPAFYVRFNIPHYPCWFFRVMQRWLLGIYWRPYGDKE